jgi:hypothetical protein
MLILIAVYLVKALDNAAVFQIMNAVTIFGFVSLILMLTWSIFVMALRTYRSRKC